MWVSSSTKTTIFKSSKSFHSNFIRTSTSLEVLELSNGFTESISLEAFHFMATAIGQSSSLKTLRLTGAPSVQQAEDLPQVIQSICKAAVGCASLVELLVDDDETQVRVQLMDQLHKALSLCNAAKNFDFGHRRRNETLDDGVATLELTRPSPWWSLLSHDIPLEVWPLILAETRFWKAEKRSHSTRDIVFFLLKEKSDVLSRGEESESPSTTHAGSLSECLDQVMSTQ